MTHKIQKNSKFGIALMLILGMGIAGCGTQPTQTIDLETNISTTNTSKTSGNLKAASLGSPVQGDWRGKWTGGATGRALANFANLSIQGGIQAGTNVRYSFAHDGNVMQRTGNAGTTLTTAYMVRVPNATKDHFEGWYTAYNCDNGCKGTVAYFEMQRNRKSNSIDGNDWSGRFDPKPLGTLAGANFLLRTQAGIAAPGGRQDGTQLDYQIGGGQLRRSGTYQANGQSFSSTAQMLEVPGTGHYIGWYAAGETSKLGFFVAANQTTVAGGTQWSMLHDPVETVPSGSGAWVTDTNGIQQGTNWQYTVNSDKDLFRSGKPAHLLAANNGSETYLGWYTWDGALHYFDATKASPINKSRGVNLAGLEFGPSAVSYNGIPRSQADLNNRTVNQYSTPNPNDIDAYVAKGVNTFRIPFRWERLQFAPSEGPGAEGTRTVSSYPINEAYFNELNALVQRATSKGARVILDMHNYGHYIRYPQNTSANPFFKGFNLIGASSVSANDFAAIWSELARRYRDNKLVMFGLMNEPLYENTTTLRDVYQIAINAIRAQGFQNEILLNGNYFGGAWSWKLANFTIPQPNKYLPDEGQRYTPANKQTVIGTNEVLATLTDSQNKLIFEAHQYFDNDYSGSAPLGTARACDASRDTNSIFTPFTEFLGSSKRGFIGEFGAWAGGANCDLRLTQAMTYLNSNNAYIGWTYWTSGTDINDKMTITPSNSQMNLIAPYLR
jgi:endoglucanase